MQALDPQLEAALLALVEGETLAPEARAKAEACLQRDAVLAARVKAMRADRAALLAGASVLAPAGLMSSVEAALERDALLGLASEERAAPAEVPVYSLPRVPRRWTAMHSGLALAASVAIVGAGVWWVMTPGSVATPNRALLARSSASNLAGDALAATEGSSEERAGRRPVEAPAPTENSGAVGPPAIAATEASTPGGEPEALANRVLSLASEQKAQAGEAAPARLAPERLAALAAEGRLALGVFGPDSREQARRLAEKPGPRGPRLVLLDSREARVVAEAAAVPSASAVVASGLSGSERRLRAGLVDQGGAKAPRAAPAGPAADEHDSKMVLAGVPLAYQALVPAEGEALEALRASFESGGSSAEWVELPAPLLLHDSPDPRMVLWWTEPTSWWRVRAAVPIIVRE